MLSWTGAAEPLVSFWKYEDTLSLFTIYQLASGSAEGQYLAAIVGKGSPLDAEASREGALEWLLRQSGACSLPLPR